MLLVGKKIAIGVLDNEPTNSPMALLRLEQGKALRVQFRVPCIQISDREMDGWTGSVDAMALGVIVHGVSIGQDKLDRASAEPNASGLALRAPTEEFGPAQAILVEGDRCIERAWLDEDVIEAIRVHGMYVCEA